MLVYRVEHTTLANSRSGLPMGPYCADGAEEAEEWEVLQLSEEINECHTADDYHPIPRMEGWEAPDDMIYGFFTEEDARWWFMDFAQDMHRVGFALRVYAVPESDVLHGKSHLAFDPQNSVLVDSLSLSN